MNDTATLPDTSIDEALHQEIRRLQKCGHSEGCAIGNLLEDALEDEQGRQALTMAVTVLDEAQEWASATQARLEQLGSRLAPPLESLGGPRPSTDPASRLQRMERLLGMAVQAMEDHQSDEPFEDGHRRLLEEIRQELGHPAKPKAA